MGRRTLSAALLLGALCAGANAMTLPIRAAPATPSPPADTQTEEGYSQNPYPAAYLPADTVLDSKGWTITADSADKKHPITNALDGNPHTFWVTDDGFKLPHTVTIDMKTSYIVDGFEYRPRADHSLNGHIGRHEIHVSTDCKTYRLAASGTWNDDKTNNVAAFEAVTAQCIQIVAISEAGNRGPWASASELLIHGNTVEKRQAPAAANPALGSWGPTINLPIVPAAAAVDPLTGVLITWSSNARNNFSPNSAGQTYSSNWDPATNTVSQRLVTNTGHDMFCAGSSLDANGQLLVTGGDSSARTSIYDPPTDAWSAAAQMTIGRGYQSQCTTATGDVFVIGGSWNGPRGGKNGEIYSTAGNKWTALPNCPVAPMLTNDQQGVYRADNHAWLFNWKAGAVLQAGPSIAMNWYDTLGEQASGPAGPRGDDTDSMCGTATMYDAVAGSVLTLGGAPSYQGAASTANAHILTLPAAPFSPVTATTINPLWSPRIFHNSVVLPGGNIFITGGQTLGAPFSDANSVMVPEMWVQSTNRFVRMAGNSIPRNYHSVAVLLRDATVVSCGGGLCGDCTTNHLDCQVFTPPYLLAADGSAAARPTIESITPAGAISAGDVVTIAVGADVAVASFEMIRYASATHTVNTDQRRVQCAAVQGATVGTWSVTMGVADGGVVTPGYWMVFAVSGGGVPSLAATVRVSVG